MFKKVSSKLDKIIKGKYHDINLDSLDEEDFKRLSPFIYKDIIVRGAVGGVLFIISIIVLCSIKW